MKGRIFKLTSVNQNEPNSVQKIKDRRERDYKITESKEFMGGNETWQKKEMKT